MIQKIMSFDITTYYSSPINILALFFTKLDRSQRRNEPSWVIINGKYPSGVFNG